MFYDFSAKLPNGKELRKTFWSHAVIPVCTVAELRMWSFQRSVIVILKVGIYEGEGCIWSWQNILTRIEDFSQGSYHETAHTNMMRELLQSGQYSDITLVCNDMKEIFAHKCLLAASPYFGALFSDKFSEVKALKINVDCSFELMKEMLSFVYSGRFCVENVENLPDLYRASLYYRFDYVAQHCEMQMMARINHNMESIKAMLRFAIRFGMRKMKEYLVKLTRKMQETAREIVYL